MKCETAILQNKDELRELIDLFKKEGVRRYLEIGCKFGGSLWHIGNDLPEGSRIVGVDLPHGDGSFKISQPHLEACIDELAKRGYDAHLILGDSTDPQIVEKASRLGPFDACMIDGNHTLPYITKDFQNYSPLSRMVIFHDANHKRVQPFRKPEKKPIEVPKFWKHVKRDYRHIEIMHDTRGKDQDSDCGYGVLWMT